LLVRVSTYADTSIYLYTYIFVFRDTIIVSLGNCLTSVFAGIVIFSFIGFMAGEMNTEVENVVDKGYLHKHIMSQTDSEYHITFTESTIQISSLIKACY